MAPSAELRGKGRCGVFAGKTVWSTPECLRGEVLTTRRYTNLRLPLPCPNKKGATKLMAVISSNLNQYSKFFYHWKEKEISDKTRVISHYTFWNLKVQMCCKIAKQS